MPNLQSVLRQEIRRFARKEVRAGLRERGRRLPSTVERSQS